MIRKFYYAAEKQGRRGAAGHQKFAVKVYEIRLQARGEFELEQISEGVFSTGAASMRQWLRSAVEIACNVTPRGYTGADYSILTDEKAEFIPLGNAPENA